MATEELDVTVTSIYGDQWKITVDGDSVEVPAIADVTIYPALDSLPSNGVGARVRVKRRDPQPPLIVGIVEVEEA